MNRLRVRLPVALVQRPNGTVFIVVTADELEISVEASEDDHGIGCQRVRRAVGSHAGTNVIGHVEHMDERDCQVVVAKESATSG